ncbi:hypothetical protein BDZ89DRAFT_1074194 [Hymenopellis radicata]|nr:hypothetical protein BDZ89DRAFT_1074194 [Hymenopellis radicata]
MLARLCRARHRSRLRAYATISPGILTPGSMNNKNEHLYIRLNLTKKSLLESPNPDATHSLLCLNMFLLYDVTLSSGFAIESSLPGNNTIFVSCAHTLEQWVSGTVLGYRDFAGRETKPGTYDALSHLLGGPIVDAESGAVIGVMLGTRMDNRVEGVRGWGTSESIFEMFSLPGLENKR